MILLNTNRLIYIVCSFVYIISFCALHVNASFGEIYCGHLNCYELINVTRGHDKASIRRAYRKLAHRYHPDRQKGTQAKAEAENHLRQLNVAYDILTDDEKRADYDAMLDNPQQMYFHYYQFYRRRYSPKVDVRIVIVVILILISVLQYVGQWTSYNQALSYLVRDPKHRVKAKEYANAAGLLNLRRKENGARLTREEMKDREEEVLRSIIRDTVELRGDCSKPSIRRVLLLQLLFLPLTCYQWIAWSAGWVWSYWICKKPYDLDAQMYLTRRHLGIGAQQWDGLDERRRQAFLNEQLWIPSKYKAYLQSKAEEARLQSAESSQYKRYRRYVKRTGGPSQFGMEDVDF